ncbi:MAG: sugar transferase [Candidatus Liptonbacteria bacterium]|nr:sugar transferase [Candidatus Liptonbacteria bacterium]
MSKDKCKILILLFGDIVVLYLALFLTLAIRYGSFFFEAFTNFHARPFSIVFALWIAVFYIAGLYNLRHLRNGFDFQKNLALTLGINALIAVSFFYLIPIFGIAPRRNLFIFLVIFAVVQFYWRRFFNRSAASGEAPNKVLLVGNGGTAEEIYKTITSNPQLGYEIVKWEKEEEVNQTINNLKSLLKEHRVNLVVVPRHLKKNERLSKKLYELLSMGIEIRDLPNFYELIFQKIPLSDLEETWFLEHLAHGHQRFYDQLKRGGEFLLALILGLVLLPLELLIAILIKIFSPGPVIYRQKRVGKNGLEFTLYKFRTMKVDAEKDGPKWSKLNDKRSTAIGHLLRFTHLDELPQLLNILRGELSFVGPRPERPEFVLKLREEIAHYDIRHLIKPGITGWAQINHRHEASVEDTHEKLQYDIYYLKNRSPVLDMSIILKTFKNFFADSS